MKTWMIIAIIVVILVLWFIGVANKLAKRKMKAENAFSDIDVFLTKRYDLIPNIVSTVKGYAKHEKDTLEAVINARNSAVSAGNIDDKIDADNKLTETIGRLFALTESYPDLKANENFIKLQDELSSIEKEISGARQYFNACVRNYNTLIITIPSNIVAKIMGYKSMKMFEASAEERKNVKVDFEN